MKASTLLRNAAQILETRPSGFGCCLINEIGRDSDEAKELAQYFLMKFEPSEFEQSKLPYQTNSGGFWGVGYKNHNDRIVGLCMAAALAESYGV